MTTTVFSRGSGRTLWLRLDTSLTLSFLSFILYLPVRFFSRGRRLARSPLLRIHLPFS